jgi:four helix bundle protein
MAYQSFENLEVWQRGCRLAVDVFRTFSDCASFTMKDQVQRAALSVPSNVAEGHERDSDREFARYLNISQGSCGELRTQLYISRKLEFLNKTDFDRLVGESREISAMLRGLNKNVAKRIPAKTNRTRTGKLKTEN